jgi:F-type H+-transporting ATPase subunit delta
VIDTTLAKRYAKALVEIGVERDALDKYGSDLADLAQLMETSRDFREVLENPVFPREEKKRVAGVIFDKLGTDPMTRNFVNLLIDRKRIAQLVGIEKAFRSEVDEIRGITRGEVSSATALDNGELNRITAALSKMTGKMVILTPTVDPSLIGGLVAKVGDMVFDGTIRTQLTQLKESLKG